MGRKFERESLDRLKSTGSHAKDQLLKRIIWALHQNEFELESQEESMEEDEYGIEFDCTSYYGEFKTLGITLKHLKKPMAIYGRYVIEVETDEDNFNVGGEFGAKAWKVYQAALKKVKPKVDEDHLLALLEDLD
jgi:hypothetical protein